MSRPHPPLAFAPSRTGRLLAIAIAAIILPTSSHAQTRADAGPWSLLARATISGSSFESEPDGYKLYSGIAIEAGVSREITRVLAIEVALRTESREATGPPNADDAIGGAEMVVLTPTLQWRPRGGSGAPFQPYLGVGGALTATWEKSGAIDSANLSPQLDPAVQLGLDFALTPRAALNLDARWQTLGVTLDDYVTPAPVVNINPLVLGLGVRVAF